MLKTPSRTQVNSRALPSTTRHHQRDSRCRFTHIVVPTSLTDQDQPALLLAAELAMMHSASLTVLHVRRPDEHQPSNHWLDAIDYLYRGLHRSARADPSHVALSHDQTRSKIRQWVELEIPEDLRRHLRVREEARSGDLAETIVRFVDEANADLVVLCNRWPRAWLPFLSAPIRRVLRSTDRQVILVNSPTHSSWRPGSQ